MNVPLTYFPAYIGLFASLMLALACNAFLDIKYGIFGIEIVFWAVVFGWTLLVGWRQHGQADDRGTNQQKVILLIGFALTILVFIPTWGFPRAGVYILGILQAAMNCVTTTRRQLHFGLLVSAVMVMFAAAHFRADWTMLFYLVPYIIAVVFTLVSEQISRRARDIREASLGTPDPAGQGLAIAAATALILTLAGLLYMLTPQPSWPYLFWRWGQPTNIGFTNDPGGPGRTGRQPGGDAGQSEGEQGGGGGIGDGGADSGRPEEADAGLELMPQWSWPDAQKMREAARRPGMPGWQSGLIERLADAEEWVGKTCSPLKDEIKELLKKLGEWLREHRAAIASTLLALLALALLAALYRLLREVRVATWVRTRFDYLWLVAFDASAPGSSGAGQLYHAMERLFALRDTPRRANANAREFLSEATEFRPHLRPQAAELIGLFERCRYGEKAQDARERQRMRELYRALFRDLG